MLRGVEMVSEIRCLSSKLFCSIRVQSLLSLVFVNVAQFRQFLRLSISASYVLGSFGFSHARENFGFLKNW